MYSIYIAMPTTNIKSRKIWENSPVQNQAELTEKQRIVHEKKRTIVFVYDFDGTLARGNIQENAFIPKIGMKPEDFWRGARELGRKHRMDSVLAYMWYTLQKAREYNITISESELQAYGRQAQLFNGVNSWFNRINEYAAQYKYKLEHIIISCGQREMIAGCSIAHHFEHIFASSFAYDEAGQAVWPALAVNHTNKVQFLFRINKYALDVSDDRDLNAILPEEHRPIPFSRMIYIGDGSTDVPAMKTLNYQGGHSIAVYDPKDNQAKKNAIELYKSHRASYIAAAKYTSRDRLEAVCQALIQYISLHEDIENEN